MKAEWECQKYAISAFARITCFFILATAFLTNLHLSLGDSKFESNRDQDWLVSTCRDQLFETADYFSIFKI